MPAAAPFFKHTMPAPKNKILLETCHMNEVQLKNRSFCAHKNNIFNRKYKNRWCWTKIGTETQQPHILNFPDAAERQPQRCSH
jgi:hypothetical protein